MLIIGIGLVCSVTGCFKSSGGTADSAANTKSSNENTGPIKITLDYPRDIPFLENDSRIKIGETYEITVDAWFSTVTSGNILHLQTVKGDVGNTVYIGLKSRIPDFNRNDPVRVVFLFKPTRIFTGVIMDNTELLSIEKR